MPKEQSPGKPTTRRYSPEEKAAAVRMVRTLRAELGTEHGTVNRVARQLGYGVESVRAWVRQADIDDGYAPGVCNRVERVRARQDRSNNVVAPRGNSRSKGSRTRGFRRVHSLTVGGAPSGVATFLFPDIKAR